LCLFFKVDNEGRRKPWMSKILGILPGLPDYCLPVSDGYYMSFWIELKAVGKKPTKRQLEKHDLLREYGHYVCWSDNLSDSIEQLLRYCKRCKKKEKRHERTANR